jgi:hypothetical protein
MGLNRSERPAFRPKKSTLSKINGRLDGDPAVKSSKKNVFKCKNGESRRFFSCFDFFIFIWVCSGKIQAILRRNAPEK